MRTNTNFVGVKSFFLALSWLCSAAMVYGQQEKLTIEQYIQRYSRLAIEEMYRAKIPASVTMAQALLESGAGNSELSLKSNNHFGIKCKGNWKGAKVFHDDDTLQECFRAYDSVYQSFKDHSDFLLSQSRYGFLFSLEPFDYKGWSYGLKKAGYATNPKYPDLLIDYIEKHQLYKLDQLQVDTGFKIYVAQEIKSLHRKEIDVNETPGIIAGADDTYQKIAVEYDMRMWQIQKYNDLPEEAACHEGDTIYLKPKRNKTFTETYKVVSGDQMRGISQKHAIKLRKLFQRNLMEPGEEPFPGEVIYLNQTRESKPKVYRTLFSKDFDKPFDYNSIYISDTVPSSKSDTKEQPTSPKEPTKNMNKKPAATVVDSMLKITPSQFKEYLWLLAQDSLRKIKKETNSLTNKSQLSHTVVAHETLYSISKKYQTSVEALTHFNHLENESLEIGQVLLIPSVNNENSGIPNIHVWKKTDRFYRVACKYSMSNKSLLKLNPGIDTTHIPAGFKIKLKKAN